jgi:peroxiredoxin
MRLTALCFVLLTCGLLRAGDVPRPAPPLSVPLPSGERITLQSLRGKVVLLEFFLTECPHCQRTATHLEPIYRDLRPRGLEVLAVAINPDALQRIPDFIHRFNTTYPIALGDSTMVRTFADISAVKQFFVPYIFLIDRKGVIRYEHPGGDAGFYNDESVNMRAELETLLKEPVRKTAAKTSAKAPKTAAKAN